MKPNPNFIHAVMMNDVSLCDDLINYYSKNSEYKQKGHSDGGDKTSTDVTIYPNTNDKTIQKYYHFLTDALSSYKEVYDEFSFPVGFSEAFNIQHYEPNEGYFDFTHTHRGVVSTTQSKTIATGWFNYLDVPAALQFIEEKNNLKN